MDFLGQLVGADSKAKRIDLPRFIADLCLEISVVNGGQQVLRCGFFATVQVFDLSGKAYIGNGIFTGVREGDGLDFYVNNIVLTQLVDRESGLVVTT